MPIVKVRVPSGEVIQVNAPEGASQEDIFAFVQSQVGASEAPTIAPQAAVAQAAPTTAPQDVPFGDLDEFVGEPVERAPAPIGEKVVGAGEAALSALTGATGGVVGSVIGAAEGAIDAAFGGIFGTQEGADEIEKQSLAAAHRLTYSPRGQEGQEYLGKFAQLMGPLQALGPIVPAGRVGSGATASATRNTLSRIAGVGGSAKALLKNKIRDSEGADPNILRNADIAINEANDVGFNLPLAAAVENSPLAALRNELGASAPAVTKSEAAARRNSANLVTQVDDIVTQLGGEGDKAVVGNKIINGTDAALKSLRKVKNDNWEVGIQEAMDLSEPGVRLNPRVTRTFLDDTIAEIRAGRLDVSDNLEGKLTSVAADMRRGLDPKQLQKNLKAFRRNGESGVKENQGVWKDLLAAMREDLHTVQGTSPAARKLIETRDAYAVASAEIDVLQNGVLGTAIKSASNGKITSGSGLVRQLTNLEPSEFKAVEPLLDKYAPNTKGAVQARFIQDAMDAAKSGEDITAGLDLGAFVKNLPSDEMFDAVFGGVNPTTKAQLVKNVNAVRRLEKFDRPIRPGGSGQENERAAALGGGAATGALSGVFAAAFITKMLNKRGLTKLLVDPQGKQLVDELTRLSVKKRLGGRALPQLSARATSFMVSLLEPETEQDISEAEVRKPQIDKDFEASLQAVENAEQVGRDPQSGVWVPHASIEGGNPTIGFGHKVTDAELKSGRFDGGISDADVQRLFREDLNKAKLEASQNVPNWDKLEKKYQNVIANIQFNTGDFTPKKWPRLTAAINRKDDEAVRREMVTVVKDSKGNVTQRLTQRAEQIADALGLR